MKTYCCMWCKPFIIIIAFCLFRQGVCLRVDAGCFCVSIRGFPRLRASQVRRVPLGAVSPLGDRVGARVCNGCVSGKMRFPNDRAL